MKDSTVKITPYVKNLIERLKITLEDQQKYKVYGKLTQSTVVGIAIQNKIDEYERGAKRA